MQDVWKTAEERITRALADLQKAQPFFAHLAMGLQPKNTPSISSAGVDAKGRMYYNEDFVMKQSIDEVMGLICHEVLHVALIHMQRIGDRNHLISNVSQDVVVNYAVARAGLKLPKEGVVKISPYRDTAIIEMPKGGSISIEDVESKNWEQIYDEIYPQIPKQKQGGGSSGGQQGQKQQNGQGQGQGQGQNQGQDQDQEGNGQGDGQGQQDEEQWGFDEHIRGDMTERERQDAENEWKSRLCEAANYAKQQGTLPLGMERMLDGLLKPKVAWKGLLLRYLKAHFTPIDWSYSRPHKKSQAIGVYLPNTLKETVECEVIVDTSGSISSKELTEFLSEIVAIAKSMPHINMWVTFVDARIEESARYHVDNGDVHKIMAMKPKGGGGTDMEVGLDYVKKHNQTVPVTVVLTDGLVPIEREAKDYPFDVIWVVTSDGRTENLSYGQVIKMDKN